MDHIIKWKALFKVYNTALNAAMHGDVSQYPAVDRAREAIIKYSLTFYEACHSFGGGDLHIEDLWVPLKSGPADYARWQQT